LKVSAREKLRRVSIFPKAPSEWHSTVGYRPWRPHSEVRINEDRRPYQGARCGPRSTARSETNATKPFYGDHRGVCRFVSSASDSFGGSPRYHRSARNLAFRPEMGCNSYLGNRCDLGRVTALKAHRKIAIRGEAATSTRNGPDSPC